MSEPGSTNDSSPVESHALLTGGRRLLHRDPDDYMAEVVILVTNERGGPVSGNDIMQAALEGLSRPGTPFFEAASAMNYERTRAKVVLGLEEAGRAAAITPRLREPTAAQKPAPPAPGGHMVGDRVRLTAPFSGRTSHPAGSTGVIVQIDDPEEAYTLACADIHAVRLENGAIIGMHGSELQIERKIDYRHH